MTQRSWSLIAAACALLACSDEERVPPAPGPTDSSNSGENKRDAGSKDQDEDAGAPPLGESPISFCTRVTPPAASGADNPVGTYLTMPGDLTLTRQVERWNDDCSELRLILEFTDGACPTGLGHSLTFSFGYQDFLDGVIHGGNNAVGADAETPAISVRYVRPNRLAKHGTWGTCEGAEGQIVFIEAPTPRAGNYVRARFQLSLSPCDGTTGDPYFLDGAFNLLMRTSATDVCAAIDSGF
jgi:hypothetical protein